MSTTTPHDETAEERELRETLAETKRLIDEAESVQADYDSQRAAHDASNKGL